MKRKPGVAKAVAYPTLALLLSGTAGADCTPPVPGEDNGDKAKPTGKKSAKKGDKKDDKKDADKTPQPPPPVPGGIGRRPQPQPQPGEITFILDGEGVVADDALVIHAHGPGEPCRRQS